ncbi:hypothetical protein SCOR_30435 [Sulfidibacter corallicola]
MHRPAIGSTSKRPIAPPHCQRHALRWVSFFWWASPSAPPVWWVSSSAFPIRPRRLGGCPHPGSRRCSNGFVGVLIWILLILGRDAAPTFSWVSSSRIGTPLRYFLGVLIWAVSTGLPHLDPGLSWVSPSGLLDPGSRHSSHGFVGVVIWAVSTGLPHLDPGLSWVSPSGLGFHISALVGVLILDRDAAPTVFVGVHIWAPG